MPLDSLESTSLPVISGDAVPATSQIARSFQYEPIAELRPNKATWTERLRPSGTSFEPILPADVNESRSDDGVKILNPLAPQERARIYHHEVSSRLELLQSWEGMVTAIDEKRRQFTARLYDLTVANAGLSEAVFDCSDVSANDRDLLKIGGVFRWMIGYRRHNYGQQERISAIVFRRLPAWDADDIELAVKYGEELAGAISIDDPIHQPPGAG